MAYTKGDIPTKNKSLSISKVNNGTVMVSVNGNFKTIVCEYDVLESVLNVVDGVNTFEKVESLFAQQYGQSAVEEFLSVLLDEEIIGIKKNSMSDFLLPKTCLVGSDSLFDKTYNVFNAELDVVEMISVNDFLTNPHINFDVAIIVPDKLNYKEILQLNSFFVKNNTPFFMVYFNGKDLVVGPFVFPWKTTCFECHITHHLKSLNKNSQILIQKSNIENLNFSYEILDDYSNAQLEFIASIIADDVKKITMNNGTFTFLETEISVAPKDYNHSNKKIYRPITDCECCHGINKLFKRYDQSTTVNITHKEEKKHKTIKYSSGGFRSVSEGETENLVKNVLENVGLNINIRRVYDNPFSSIIPVFDSALKTTHKNKTPYFFREQISHGKGISEKQAYFSAAFEIFERLSARYYGEKEIIRGSVKEVTPYNIDLEAFINQIHNSNTSYEKYNKDVPIDWVWGKSLITGDPKLIPASMVFLTDTVFRGQFYGGSSSGLSAGATLEDAILQGLFELIEHDAWMIGQANPIQLPIIETSSSKNIALKNSIAEIESRGYKIISRDYTNDIGIPVIRTWISNPDNYSVYATNGFGASVSAELALERSLTEAIQSAAPQSLSKIHKYSKLSCEDLLFSPCSIYSLYYFQQKDMKNCKNKKDITEFKGLQYSSVAEVLSDVVSRIKKAIPNCDIVFVDLTRKAFGIHAVRVIITDEIQRLNVPLITLSPRLFNFQKNMCYSNDVPSYEDLYMAWYPH